MNKTRNPVGWGYVEDALSEADVRPVLDIMQPMLNRAAGARRPAPSAQNITLSTPPVSPPKVLQGVVATDHETRLLHAAGRSFRDLATLRAGRPLPAPAAVATPRDERELADVLAWASDTGLAGIPFGGGSSVVGGVNPEDMGDWPGAVTIDLQRMNRVLEVSERDRVVHAQAGILGPELEARLSPHGLGMRHYPQSYFHSTLGGWVATRGAGHFSTLRAKIEDRVQALSVMLPDGSTATTRPLPASSIGPDPNRLWCGSEGALGIITDVRLRVVASPAHKHSAAVGFTDFESALEATRAIVQAELWPAQMRVLDPFEHMVSSAQSGAVGEGALMILGFEGPRDVALQCEAALEIAREHGGTPRESSDGGTGSWRDAFFRQPYMRDALLDYAVIVDTFETAVPWSAVPAFYHHVVEATGDALEQIAGAGGVACRVTHAYPDGVALYFSFYAPGEHAALLAQWQQIKSAASEAVIAGGGTMSHHHAMGRDHKHWVREEIPAAFRSAIRGAKQALDPSGMLNPGLWFAD
ncbi:FAD-binding oxidoreductase [Salinisphaera aquimarina]|uniref:FAD-binding oxidoreductase n=1 Tax=Salinisphaera aquimarina TaxID=2094031 RepID=A0ABV7EJF5_9GAMM